MRKSNVDRYQEAQSKDREPESLTLDEFAAKLVDIGKHKDKAQRILNPTQKSVIFSPHFMNAYMGAAGAAKTSSICATGFMRALFQPGSKGLVGRYDYNKLLMTTAVRMEEMLSILPPGTLVGRDKSPPMTWKIKPIVDGPLSTITFMGLKDPLGSIELDWAIVDEADEVEEKRIQELKMRMRNPVPGMEDGYDPYAIFLAFNPPDVTHWLYTACTGKDAKGRHVSEPWLHLFMPTFGENSRNLPRGYYEEKGKDLPEDLKLRLVMGQWGTVFPGTPVYGQFRWGVHVKRGLKDLTYDPDGILYRFWDFGYNNPACIFAQLSMQGHLRRYYELVGSKMEIQDFARAVKGETVREFPHQRERIVDFGDPAVRQKKDTGSTLAELMKAGIHINYRITLIDHGVRLIRTGLNQLINGEPVHQFDEHGVPTLISAYKGGYRMNELGTEPKKDGYYDHPADADRYGCVNLLDGGGPVNNDATNLPTNLGYNGEYGQ